MPARARRCSGEPPFAPEFDGFDPGDEPLDDVVDEKTARQSSEAQALQLLQEKLGAEKIAELDNQRAGSAASHANGPGSLAR